MAPPTFVLRPGPAVQARHSRARVWGSRASSQRLVVRSFGLNVTVPKQQNPDIATLKMPSTPLLSLRARPEPRPSSGRTIGESSLEQPLPEPSFRHHRPDEPAAGAVLHPADGRRRRDHLRARRRQQHHRRLGDAGKSASRIRPAARDQGSRARRKGDGSKRDRPSWGSCTSSVSFPESSRARSRRRAALQRLTRGTVAPALE